MSHSLGNNNKSPSNNSMKFNNALKIDKNEIESFLSLLRTKQDEMITTCDNSLLEKLNNIKAYVNNFHGTSSYKDFFDLVVKHFGDIKEPLPGTIGAFFIGYYAYNGDLDNVRCAATCVDSIPLPDHKDSPCMDNVVVLYRFNSKTYCKPINLNRGTTKSYIHLMGDITNKGLNNDEKNLLASFGIFKGEIYTYIDGFYKYVNSYSNLRVNIPTKNNSSVPLVLIVIALVVLVLLFVRK